jgi:hypothetical protein
VYLRPYAVHGLIYRGEAAHAVFGTDFDANAARSIAVCNTRVPPGAMTPHREHRRTEPPRKLCAAVPRLTRNRSSA